MIRKIHWSRSIGQTNRVREFTKKFSPVPIEVFGKRKKPRETQHFLAFRQWHFPALTLPEGVPIIAPLSWMARPVFCAKTG